MTISTSCSYSNGPYQWSAIDLAVDEKHVGYGKTRDEAIADLARLLNERAEAAEQDAKRIGGDQDSRPAAPAQPVRVNLDEQLEMLIDRYGIGNVLECLSAVCGAKSEHIAVNWQDAHLAKRWATVEGAIGVVVPKANGL